MSDLVLERRLSHDPPHMVRVYRDLDARPYADEDADAIAEGDAYGIELWDDAAEESVDSIWGMVGYGSPEAAACAAIGYYWSNKYKSADLDVFFRRMGCADHLREEPAVADTSKGYGIDLNGTRLQGTREVFWEHISKDPPYFVRVYFDDHPGEEMPYAVELWSGSNMEHGTREALLFFPAPAGVEDHHAAAAAVACEAFQDLLAGDFQDIPAQDLEAFYVRWCNAAPAATVGPDTSKGYGIDLSGLGQVDPHEDEFVVAFFDALLWSSTDDDGTPLDRDYTDADLASEARDPLEREARAFYRRWHNEILSEPDPVSGVASFTENNDSQAGHDFALTRNGHGAGFWDGDWPVNGDLLTQGSKDYPEVNLYVGDDGLIWAYGYEAGAYFRYNGSKQVSVLLPDATWLGPFTSQTAARNAYFKRVDVAPVDDQSQGYSIDLD